MEYTKVVSIGGNEYAEFPGEPPVRLVTYYGNSSRVKPKRVDGARDAFRLMETDTGKIYVFDEEIDDWREIKKGG